MKELRSIVAAWRSASKEAQIVLVTVVDIKGSSYRRPGAHLLIVDGRGYGSISGGCLEADLLSTSWERTESGPVVAVFDTTSDEDALFGYGLGCRGIVTVFLRRVLPDDPQLSLFEEHLDGRRRTHTLVEVEGTNPGRFLPGQAEWGTGIMERLGARYFAQQLDPPVLLNIYGAGFDSLPLAALALELGWLVQIRDHRVSVGEERFPSGCTIIRKRHSELVPADDLFSAHVVMTHNFEQDLIVLGKLLKVQSAYLGALGPRARTIRLLEHLEAASRLDEVRTPVGLDIGAESPEEIALSVVAEIQAVLRGRSGGFLKDRPQRIHASAGPL